MDLAFHAMDFARSVHATQERKYTGNPYSDHLAEVAGIVATVQHEFMVPPGVILATAWLHDCVEDQGVSLNFIAERFGNMVAIGVSGLSDMEKGNRAERKAASRERLAACSSWIQTVKCADLISNTSSIVKHDPQFAVTYLAEKRALLDALTKADPRLRELAYEQSNWPKP